MNHKGAWVSICETVPERGTRGVRVIEMGKKSSGFEARNQGFLKLNGLEVCKRNGPAS